MEQKIVCPRCGSDQLSANKKGFSVGKAVGGLLIPGGVLWGFHGSKKVMITCLACAKQFNAGEGKIVNIYSDSTQTSSSGGSSYQRNKNANASAKETAQGCLIMIVIIGIIILWVKAC